LGLSYDVAFQDGFQLTGRGRFYYYSRSFTHVTKDRAAMHYRRLIALLIVCSYLILPLDSFANLHPPFAGSLSNEATRQLDKSAPDGGYLLSDTSPVTSLGGATSHCPCSDRHGSDDCNFSCSCCSCCSFFAPLPAGIAWRALQPVTSFSMLEPIQRFPEVYLPIFVPPQNLKLT
jgi:hypothetical protein